MSARSILITGCSTGIGYDAAHRLARRGWQVFASCRRPEDCERLRAEGLASPVIDHADESSIASGLAEVLEATGGRLDALYLNGAHATPGAVEDLPRGALREIFEANVFGVHDLARRALPAMRAQGHGRIVVCSSVLGFVATPWRGAYVSTKFALEGLVDALRLELRGSGIHAILLQPGPIDTPFRRNSIPHFERWIDWENSAHSAFYRTRGRPWLYGEGAAARGPTAGFQKPPSAVSDALIRALEDTRPRARYRVTVPTHVLAAARRVLPVGALDWLLSRG